MKTLALCLITVLSTACGDANNPTVPPPVEEQYQCASPGLYWCSYYHVQNTCPKGIDVDTRSNETPLYETVCTTLNQAVAVQHTSQSTGLTLTCGWTLTPQHDRFRGRRTCTVTGTNFACYIVDVVYCDLQQ